MFRLMFMLFGWMLSSALDTDDGGEPDNEEPDDKPTLTQKQHEYELAKRLKREREKFENEREEDRKKAEDERKKAEKKAEEEALKEQGKFKEIADQRQESIVSKDAELTKKDERISELEKELEALTPHRESNEKRAEELMKNVPESVRELLAERDPLKQLEWLDKNPDLAGLPSERKPNGSRPSPRPVQDMRDDKRDEDARRVAERQKVASF